VHLFVYIRGISRQKLAQITENEKLEKDAPLLKTAKNGSKRQKTKVRCDFSHRFQNFDLRHDFARFGQSKQAQLKGLLAVAV